MLRRSREGTGDKAGLCQAFQPKGWELGAVGCRGKTSLRLQRTPGGS